MRKNLIPIVSIAISLIISFPVFGNPIYAGEEVDKIITYDENGNKVITLIFDPEKTPDFMKETSDQMNMETETNKKIMPFTKAPEIGVTLGHILNENAAPNAIGASRFMEAYQVGLSGQCTWYAAGRFREVYGIELPYMQNAKKWIANAVKSDLIKTITDLNDVPEQSIAVFEPTNEFKDWAGHVSFVEYVERDINSIPINIYYTDANGSDDLRKNEFDAGYDGAVKMREFKEFRNPYGLKLIGYIVPKDTK